MISVLKNEWKETLLILGFYLLVAASSIVNLGVLGQVGFIVMLAVSSLYSPRTAAIVLLAFFYLPVGGLHIPNIFIVATIFVAVLNFRSIRKNFENKITIWILKLYSCFFLFRLLSIVSVDNLPKYWQYILVSFSVLVHIIVFSCLINGKKDINVILKYWGVIGALSSILGYIHFMYADVVYLRQIVQIDSFYDKASIEGSLDWVRWIWVGAEPNFTGLNLLIPLAINLGFLFKKFSLFNLLLSIITLLGILGTYSRTSFLVSIIIIVLFILFSNAKYKLFFIALIPISAFVIALYFPEFVDRIDTIQTAATEGQGSGRFPLYLESIDNFCSSPIIGIGAGQTPVVSKYKLEAHNLFLQTLGENGIFGFVFIMLLFVKSLKMAFSLRTKEPMFLIGLIAVLINCNTVSAFDLRTILSFVIIISYFYMVNRSEDHVKPLYNK